MKAFGFNYIRRPSDLRSVGQHYGFTVKIEGLRNSDFRILAFGLVFGFSDFRLRSCTLVFRFLDFALRSKTEGLKQTGPNLDRDRSGPFSRTDGLGSVRLTESRSVFGLPYLE